MRGWDNGSSARDKPATTGPFSQRAGRLCMVLHAGFPHEVRVAAEARVAVNEGYELDVIALRRPGEAKSEWVEGARVYRLPIAHLYGGAGPRFLLEYLGFALFASLKLVRLSIRRRYDIVQIHNPPDFLVAAAFVPRLLGAKVLFDVHDLAPDMFHMRFHGQRGAGVADRTLRSIERAAGRWADAVLTVHEPYRAELAGRGIPEQKITVVMNTLDETLLPPPEDAGPQEEFAIFYHGTVTPHYGVDLLIDAAAEALPQIPSLTIEIYGEGDSIRTLEERAAKLGIGARLHVCAPLSQRDVLTAVRGASAGVVPNLPLRLNEFALSTKLFEYVCLGVPVVCADLPTMRAHFSPEEVLFFRAGDASALAEALVETAQDPEAAAARVAAARRRYEAYRWPIQARRYADLLAQLMNRSRPGKRDCRGRPVRQAD